MIGQGATELAVPAGQPATIGLWPQVRARKPFFALIGALVVLAWLGLVLWTWSPYGRFLNHEEVGDVAPASGDYLRLLAVFVAGWTLMTVAMMLPTSLPLIAFFQALVRGRPNHVSLVGLLATGYLAVWVAFAAVVHLSDQGIHMAVEQVSWLERNPWSLAAFTFLWAGVYQFSPLKFRCLDKCRSPVGFVMSRWRGGRERAAAFGLGVRHGLFCLGCCWSLMLLMFAVGIGNIGWMLVLGAVMTIEKNVAWGRRLTAPVGVALLVSAGALAVVGTVGKAA